MCLVCPPGRASSGNAEIGSSICHQCGPGLQSKEGAAFCSPTPRIGSDERQPQWGPQVIEAAWANSGNITALRAVKVEDRTYFINLFTPSSAPKVAGALHPQLPIQAYWWEWLPPRETEESSTCSTGSFLRPVGDLLESVVSSSDASVRGVWLTYSGDCESGNSGRRVRRAYLLLKCDPELSGEDPVPSFAQNARPLSMTSCEDVALEWRSFAACPLCNSSDWQPVISETCIPVQGRKVTHVAARGCFGGVKAPQEYWEPCDGQAPIEALIVLLSTGGCMVCCLSCYVVLLRRRYAKYFPLDESSTASGQPVPASNIGAHQTREQL